MSAGHLRTVIGILAFATSAMATASSGNDLAHAIAATRAAMMVDPATALQRADEAEQLARRLTSEARRGEAIAVVLRLKGEAYVRLDKTDQAAPLLAKALAIARRRAPGTKLEADILLSSGGVHAGRGEPAAAFGDYQAAYQIFQQIGDVREQAVVLTCISTLYFDANDYLSALKYLDEGLAIGRGDPNLMLSIYNNRATYLLELGRFVEAEAGDRKALVLAREMNSSTLQARILGNIARVRLKIGDVTGAKKIIRDAQRLTQGDDATAQRLQLAGIAAQAAYQQHDYQLARTLIAQRFTGVDLTTTTGSFREAHQTAYATYRALGDAPRAIVHLVALKRLDDQATRLATSANSALAAASFDFANQKLRIATLQRDDANRQARYERQRAQTERLIFLGLSIATAIIFALLAVWLVTMRRSRNRMKAAADDLAVTNTALGKALAAKTEFLATTSHEIRTPLNGILGMTQVMLADPRLPMETRERVGVVHGAGVTMRALVDDILDVAKMETGNLTIERAPFDLAATLVEAAKLWREQAHGKGIGFVIDLENCPTWIEGDAARIRQIAFNLLSNALKFTAAGQVSLRVDHHADRLHIVVADSGIGIAADAVADIFEAFKQADAGTTRQFGGTGLGLAICRNLARAMDGEIEVASTVGAGSTFTVTLPLLIASPPNEIGAAANPPSGADGVVIVDANPITRAMLKTIVTPHAVETVAVASLKEALPFTVGAATVLIDQSALIGEQPIAMLAALDRASVFALWRGEVPTDVAQVARVIAKPVSGPALIEHLFGSPSQRLGASALVQRAA